MKDSPEMGRSAKYQAESPLNRNYRVLVKGTVANYKYQQQI